MSGENSISGFINLKNSAPLTPTKVIDIVINALSTRLWIDSQNKNHKNNYRIEILGTVVVQYDKWKHNSKREKNNDLLPGFTNVKICIKTHLYGPLWAELSENKLHMVTVKELFWKLRGKNKISVPMIALFYELAKKKILTT